VLFRSAGAFTAFFIAFLAAGLATGLAAFLTAGLATGLATFFAAGFLAGLATALPATDAGFLLLAEAGFLAGLADFFTDFLAATYEGSSEVSPLPGKLAPLPGKRAFIAHPTPGGNLTHPGVSCERVRACPLLQGKRDVHHAPPATWTRRRRVRLRHPPRAGAGIGIDARTRCRPRDFRPLHPGDGRGIDAPWPGLPPARRPVIARALILALR